MDIVSSLSLLLYLPGSDKREKGTNGLSSEQKGPGVDFGFFKGVFFKHSPKKGTQKMAPRKRVFGVIFVVAFFLC